MSTVNPDALAVLRHLADEGDKLAVAIINTFDRLAIAEPNIPVVYKLTLPIDDSLIGGISVPLTAGPAAYQIYVEAVGIGEANLESAIASFIVSGILRPHDSGGQVMDQANVITPQTTLAASGVTVTLANTAGPLLSKTIAVVVDCSSLDNPATMNWVIKVTVTPVTA